MPSYYSVDDRYPIEDPRNYYSPHNPSNKDSVFYNPAKDPTRGGDAGSAVLVILLIFLCAVCPPVLGFVLLGAMFIIVVLLAGSIGPVLLKFFPGLRGDLTWKGVLVVLGSPVLLITCSVVISRIQVYGSGAFDFLGAWLGGPGAWVGPNGFLCLLGALLVLGLAFVWVWAFAD